MRSDNGNHNRNRDTQTTTQRTKNGIADQQATPLCQRQHVVTMTSFPPSATGTSQQLEPERDPTMASATRTSHQLEPESDSTITMAIVTQTTTWMC